MPKPTPPGRRYHDVPAWQCAQCSTDRATQMCAHVFQDGSTVSTCSPDCLEQLLSERSTS